MTLVLVKTLDADEEDDVADVESGVLDGIRSGGPVLLFKEFLLDFMGVDAIVTSRGYANVFIGLLLLFACVIS
jgi:hypothetical protein